MHWVKDEASLGRFRVKRRMSEGVRGKGKG